MRELTKKEIDEYEMLTANAKQLSFDDLLGGGVKDERRKDTYTGEKKGAGKRTTGSENFSRSV